MISFIDSFYRVIWGPPLIIAIVGIGLYFTIALRGLQFRYLAYGLRLAFSGEHHGVEKGEISHFQSLMTSLAATIGIANIAGVATAMTVGGPGALFWMWVTGWLGMAIKYAESILAVKYRIQDEAGEYCGGPMFFIDRGLGFKGLAVLFSVCGAIAALGGGNMLQANTIVDVLYEGYGVSPWLVSVLLSGFVGLVIMGGVRSVGRVASIIVPAMALLYLGGGFYIILSNVSQVPAALSNIITSAFSLDAATGGISGTVLAIALQTGISRGLMTSEAGLGTGSIAAAAAKTDCAGRQALVSMTGSFLSTVVMCTVTALVLSISEVLSLSSLTGASLTSLAFQSSFSFGGAVVSISTVLFGFTTLLGWAFYGEKCVEYLMGQSAVLWYRLAFTLTVIPGGLLDLGVVWRITDVANAMMAIPTLIGIACLHRVVIDDSRTFLNKLKKEETP